ncbi:MAG: prepilin-type N-terminal cleavage/methylation domain-containing protein [Candidatus Omnitrophota bacterium]|nr:prepilin-type N-terminal cleavage/methylation domain-containing protein [Candidatus Omnitrophota bacterium]
MRHRSFTILELVVVLIILGILIAIGFAYYGVVIERLRGAEARTVIKQIREEAAALYLQERGNEGFNDVAAGIGLGIEPISGPTQNDCTDKYYFWYKIEAGSIVSNFTVTATRCLAGGKTPNGIVSGYLRLLTNFTAQTDIWLSEGGY